MPEIGPEQATLRAEFEDVLAARAAEPLRAMASPSSVLLLTGDSGAGKGYLAEYVARTLEATSRGAVRAFILRRPDGPATDPQTIFGDLFPSAFADEASPDTASVEPTSVTLEATGLATRLIELARASCGTAEPLFVLPGVDHYSPSATAVLEQLIRQQGARVIATARRITGGANHMGHDPRVTRLTVPPLEVHEAGALLASLLGNTRLANSTLTHWHALTGGNSHALMLMLIANERSGTLKRLQGVAYVPPGQEQIPEELAQYVQESCTEAEARTLEMLALGEPMLDAPLLRLLDPQVTNTLLDRGLVSTHPDGNGRSVLRISRPILAAALRARMSPARRIELAEVFFLAYTDGRTDGEDLARCSPMLLRTVAFGLECGASLPHDWLTGAVERLLVELDPPLLLRVSLALANSYSTSDAAAAAIRALSLAVQLGDGVALEAAHRRIDHFVADPELYAGLPSMLRTRLSLAQIERLFTQGTPLETVLATLDRFESALDAEDTVSREAVRGLRFRLLMRDGELAAAANEQIDTAPSSEILVEWVRAPAHSISSLLLQQQGALEEAIRRAHRARSISLIGRRPLNDLLELQGFYWFLGYWVSGCATSAQQALEEIRSDAVGNGQAGAGFSELNETGWALLALQEARWRDAAEIVDLIMATRGQVDRYGTGPLLSAIRALALGALGERQAAVADLRRARAHRRGVSQALAGFRMRIALQAQQWLRVGDPGAEAVSLAHWAGQQELRLVELQAWHVAAMESRSLARDARSRARELAEGVDPLVAEVILAHIEKIAEGASPTDVSEPEVRLLADLGLWVPLPGSSGLSPREREIALLASLGYASRFIAERFHLSVRTVETHLAHVYAKLSIADRAELREWFSADRRVSDDTRSFEPPILSAVAESRIRPGVRSIRSVPRIAARTLREKRLG